MTTPMSPCARCPRRSKAFTVTVKSWPGCGLEAAEEPAREMCEIPANRLDGAPCLSAIHCFASAWPNFLGSLTVTLPLADLLSPGGSCLALPAL